MTPWEHRSGWMIGFWKLLSLLEAFPLLEALDET
jgi:hypothetical protein